MALKRKKHAAWKEWWNQEKERRKADKDKKMVEEDKTQELLKNSIFLSQHESLIKSNRKGFVEELCPSDKSSPLISDIEVSQSSIKTEPFSETIIKKEEF